VKWRFFNSPEQGSSPATSPCCTARRADTLAMMRELQRATDEVAARFEAEHGVNPLTYAIGQIGGNAGRGLPGAEVKEDDLLGRSPSN
jgi:hypothetical protein